MATVYSNHCCLESWLWTSKLSVSFFVTQPCKCSLTIILSYTLLKLIEFCQVETSLVHVRGVAAAHTLSMVMWYHQNIVNSYHLIKLTHLFKPLLVRVLMVKFPIVSLSFATLSWSFACHLHFRKLNPKGMPKNSKKEKMCTKLAWIFPVLVPACLIGLLEA